MSASQKPAQGPAALVGSDGAKRKMALVLEAIAGLRTIQSACTELGIAVPQYYALETRMLQAMIDALEPRKRGRKVDVVAELERQRKAYVDLERELMRVQALYRTTQRAVGVKEPVRGLGSKKPTTRTRRLPKKTRGERIAEKIGRTGDGRIGPSKAEPSSGGGQ